MIASAPGRIRRNGALAASCVLLFLAAGCAHRPAGDGPEAPRPAWPPPPDAARIEFVRTVRVPADLGIRGSVFKRIMRAIIYGRQQQGMDRPYAVTVAAGGTIAVADPDGRCVHLFDTGRAKYRRLEEADGAPLLSPVGVASDGEGRLYVSDSMRAAIYRFDGEGRWLDALAPGDALVRPTGLAFDPGRGVLWAADTGAHCLVGFGPEGREVARIGERGSGDGQFNYPVAVAVDGNGRLYVTDSMNFRVQVLEADGRFVRAFGRAGNGPGDFDKAKGIAVDADGHVYVVEGLHDVVHVYDADGRLLTVVGASGSAAGEFVLPAGIHIDHEGNILVADSANHRIQVLRYLGAGGRQGAGS